jgi:stearoyl-CoA desaturase (delta-9 desaturase)
MPEAPAAPRARAALLRWFDTAARPTPSDADADAERIDWVRALPFFALHVACLAVFFVGVSPTAVVVAVALYALRMFALTAFYHRYFSHKAFRCPRLVQFAFAAIGAMCVQRGPLWWAAHHRTHHRHADTPRDPHSPLHRTFLQSHMGWFLTSRAFATDFAAVPDLAKFPELRLLDRFDILMPTLLAIALYALGEYLAVASPSSGTNGMQLFVWGFCVSTVALFHATFLINSLAHRFGTRRFETRDASRNNWLLALLTFGEGWHNNHHRFPGSARQGFRWWEIDATYYVLRALAALRLVSDLKPVPVALRVAPATEPPCESR